MNFRIALLFLASAVFALTVAGILTGEENIQEADLWARSSVCGGIGENCTVKPCCVLDACVCTGSSMTNCWCQNWV
uniref:U58-Deinotoxin-Dsu1c_1 n=1 Tax=Deinopis subrufa TaxID=1905329 RepID=A0A4Q8KDC1_DEISU